ncbi:DUF3817 domain-containing protein [Rhodococcus sp. X156]|uniref:DUF3817 domain-containing protein n=1 Tax=Rhodococcus sp. X156 TaxID=2499145 RepID=UPI000FD98A9F|nr:DUF3817 domain-containing protein [Rhodococcus sp. X156]
MASAFDLRTPAARFRLVAVLEALSWAGLLVAMFFKWVLDMEAGVPVMGPIHGAAFVAYVIVALLTMLALRWDVKVTALALVASVPPFGSIIFERWADKRGLLGDRAAGTTPGAPTSERVAR